MKSSKLLTGSSMNVNGGYAYINYYNRRRESTNTLQNLAGVDNINNYSSVYLVSCKSDISANLFISRECEKHEKENKQISFLIVPPFYCF